MIGIIATIILAKKGYTVFAWIMGIWSALEIFAILCNYPSAVGPGGVFLIIAICIKNKNSDKNIRIQPTVMRSVPTAYQKCNAIAAETSSTNSNAPTVQWGAFEVCPLCHKRQKAGLERCLNCNARLLPKVEASVENWSSAELDDAETFEAQAPETVALPQVSEQETEESQDRPVTRFCRKCGFQLLNDSDFCSHCGTKIVTVPQEPLAAESPADTTIGAETETEVHVVRDQEFWEQLQQFCIAAQEQFKEQTLPLLSDAGLLSASGNTVQVDINDMKRPLLVITELWAFPIAVLVAALNEYLPSITEEDEQNIKKYLYSCVDPVLQTLQRMAGDETRILYGRMNDYNTACKEEMVCGFSSYGQGKILFHDFEEFELCAGNKNHEAKCSLLFGDFLYYYNYYGSLPSLEDIRKLKKVVTKNSAKYAEKYENLYMSVHPFVCALYSKVKSITGA